MSQNVFTDLGFESADEMLVKAGLAMRISDRITRLGLTQKQAAQRLHVDQPSVSRLINGNLDDFSTDRLMKFLMRLGNDVEIRVKTRPRSEAVGRMSIYT